MNGLGRTKLSLNSDGSAHLVVHCTCTRDVANTEIFLKARSRFWKPNFPNHITSRAVFTINCNACQLSFGLNQLGSYMWLRGGLSDKSALFRFVCDKSALFKQYSNNTMDSIKMRDNARQMKHHMVPFCNLQINTQCCEVISSSG